MSFKGLYELFSGRGHPWVPDWVPVPAFPEWLAFILAGFTLAFLVINVVIMTLAFYTWFERRVLGRFQSRLGPNRWGPFGLFQPFADLIKLITKEDIIPDDADRPVARNNDPTDNNDPTEGGLTDNDYPTDNDDPTDGGPSTALIAGCPRLPE